MASPTSPTRFLYPPPTPDNYTTPLLATFTGGNSTALLQHCCASTSLGAITQYQNQVQQYCNVTDCHTATVCMNATAPALSISCFYAATPVPNNAAKPRTTMNPKLIVAIGVLALPWVVLN